MRNVRVLLLAVLAVILSPYSAGAAELRMITIDAAPWASLDQAGRPVGAFPDIVAEIERRSGHRIAMTVQPFPRIDRELETGSQDCTIILWNDRRSRIVERGEEVYMMTFGVIARPGLPLRAYDDLRPLTVSVIRGLAIDPRFDADSSIRKDADKDYEIGIRKIAHGRLDAIAGAIPTIRHIARQIGLSDRLGEELVMTRIPLTLQCAKASPRLGMLDEVGQVIRAMRDDGTLARLLARHDYN